MSEQNSKTQTFPPPAVFRDQALCSDSEIYEIANRDPVTWWAKQAEALDWFTPWEQTFNDENPPFYRWFEGGKLNASYNCLDRHVLAGNGGRVAYHWHGEEGETRTITYSELYAEVQRFANVLKQRGINKGDIVGIYVPMIPELVVAVLACARIGAVHNVVFGGFSAEAMSERMAVSQAKALVVADGLRRKGSITPVKQRIEEHLQNLPAIETVVVIRHTGSETPMQSERDIWYHEGLQAVESQCPPEPLDAEHPLFVLYSSGSTAKPKGILHTTGGYLTGVAWTHKHVFDLHPETDVYWCTADVGWITGHSYVVYGPLLNGATSVMYEGAPNYPDKAIWWSLVEHYGVTIFYTAPTAIRSCVRWGKEHPGQHDLSSLRLLGSVGEPIDPKSWLWYHEVIGGGKCPIVDTWWQTETGHIMLAPLPGITATKPGSATHPLPGVGAAIYDEEGNEVAEGEGFLVLTHPWPGMLRTLYGDDQRYQETYFSRFGESNYFTSDEARRDEDGYLWVVGRVDDVMNISGHRLSTAEIEAAIVAAENVAEAAVISIPDELSGQAAIAFVTLEEGFEGTPEEAQVICASVTRQIGKLARPKSIIWARDLPKTRSGKIMRRLLRDIAKGKELGDTTTLSDPTIMVELQAGVAKVCSDQ